MRAKRAVALTVAVLLGSLVPVLAPAPAGAGVLPVDVVLVDGGESILGLPIPFTGSGSSPGAVGLLDHDNHLVVTVSPDQRTVTFTDPGALFVAVPPCIGGLGTATCQNTTSNVLIDWLRLGGGPGDDRIEVRAPAAVRDSIIGADGNDTLIGGPGQSMLDGMLGNDVLRGGDGHDFLIGEGGSDDISGGPGLDVTMLPYTYGPVTVTMDELPNDGGPGELDNIRDDVEGVDASTTPENGFPGFDPQGGDTFVGNDLANGFMTHNPPAVLSGGGGDDGLGVNLARGIAPPSPPSSLHGEDGNDRLSSTSAPATFDGGAGDDDIYARNGFADTISCGTGADVVRAEVADVVAADCETVLLA